MTGAAWGWSILRRAIRPRDGPGIEPRDRSPSARRLGTALLLGVAVSLAVTIVSQIGALSGWETRMVDAFIFLRERAPVPEIVLVVVDDADFHELGERQPLSRRYLADLGDILLEGHARVVVFDVFLRSPSTSEEDAALVAMARRWETRRPGSLIFASLAVPGGRGQPTRYGISSAFSIQLPGMSGFSSAPLDTDGVVRRMQVVLPATRGGFLPSLALAALAGYAGQSGEALSRALRSDADGTLHLPARDQDGQITHQAAISLRTLSDTSWRIDFVGAAGSFTTFSSGPVARLARSGVHPSPDNPFRGKIVLVGAAFQESREFYATPVGLMSGVEIQANMVETLLSRRSLRVPHVLLNVAVLTGACLAVAVLSLWLRPLWVALATLAMIAGFVAVSYGAYTRAGYWLDFLAPLLGITAYLEGSRLIARRRVRAAFGQYVSPEVMDVIVREGKDLAGKVRTASVLMSDLREFTTLCEQLPPADVSQMINEYFTAMVDVIMTHRGIVIDFVGDGILAVYGAAADDADHAWHGVVTALEMQAALGRLNERWHGEGRPPLAMGIAVHTGEVFAGTVGSRHKKKYAVLGDTVNTVARIEALNSQLATAILISGATAGAVRDHVVVQDRGRVNVKGKVQPVELFELLGLADGSRRMTGVGRA